MRYNVIFALAWAPSLLVANASHALEPGAYSGGGENGEALTVNVADDLATIEVVTSGCQGDTQGRLESLGENRWQIRPDWPGCVIEFQESNGIISVREGRECFQLHGAMCSFNGTVTSSTENQTMQDDGSSGANGDVWTYGSGLPPSSGPG